MSGFPDRVDDGSVTLRRVVAGDARDFAEAFVADPQLWIRLGLARPWTEALVLDGLAEEATGRELGEWARWAIARNEDDRLVGTVALRDVDRRHRRCELGIWLAPGARGGGVALRAMRLAERVAFGRLGLNRLFLVTEASNRSMRALAARAGYREEGVMREYERQPDGSFVDLVLAARLARDASF